VAEHLPQGSIHRHAHERDDLRTESVDLLLEAPPAFEVLCRLQHVDAGARTRHEVRHTDAPLGQPHVVFMGDRLGNDAGFVEETPEAIGGSGEVMARERRRHAWIDADEQHAHARFDSVGQA
jgi:hypothetical protein